MHHRSLMRAAPRVYIGGPGLRADRFVSAPLRGPADRGHFLAAADNFGRVALLEGGLGVVGEGLGGAGFSHGGSPSGEASVPEPPRPKRLSEPSLVACVLSGRTQRWVRTFPSTMTAAVSRPAGTVMVGCPEIEKGTCPCSQIQNNCVDEVRFLDGLSRKK